MGKTIGLKGLFRMAGVSGSKDSGSSYKGDHRSAGTSPAKARISRVKGAGRKSPATKRGYKAPMGRPGRRP